LAKKEIDIFDNSFSLSYEKFSGSRQKKALILHGWGSNKELMKNAFEPHLSFLERVYIDLPGFGSSSNDMVLDSRMYALIVERFLEEIDFPPDIVIGHSFGGKIAALLNPKELVLMGSSGILLPKSLGVRAKIATVKLLKPLGLKKFANIFKADDAKGLSPIMYDTFKTVVDEDFSSVYEAFGGEALLLWGRDDSATPLEAARKIESLIKNSELCVYEGGHFFFLDKGGIIAQKIGDRFAPLV